MLLPLLLLKLILVDSGAVMSEFSLKEHGFGVEVVFRHPI